MSNELKCVLMRGYAGCGKSFKAKELAAEWGNTVICSADDYWITSTGFYAFDVTKLKQAHDSCFNKFKKAIEEGRNVIVDNTNLKYDDCKRYFEYVLKNNNLNKTRYAIDFCEVSFNSIEKAISLRSNNEDGKNIPEDKMRSMYTLFKRNSCVALMYSNFTGKINFVFPRDIVEYSFLENAYTPSNNEAIICDLDGTISLFKMADGTELRNCYAAETSNADLINVAVAKAISAFELTGHKVIFLSGRESKYREPTIEFLNRVSDKFGLSKDITLYMRASGDNRSDDIVKSELYYNHIKDKYNVVAVFDDRPKVVRLWRSLGLFVFDCNYRNEEF